MRRTEKQKAELRARFRQKQRYQVAALVPAIGGVAVLVVGDRYAEHLGFGPLALGAALLILVAAGFSWFNWRCPACRRLLGWTLSPGQCPACKLELRA